MTWVSALSHARCEVCLTLSRSLAWNETQQVMVPLVCPGDALERWTMAVWTVRALDGEEPPAVTSTRFPDVYRLALVGRPCRALR